MAPLTAIIEFTAFVHFSITICAMYYLSILEWFDRLTNKSIQWEGRLGTAGVLPFDGVPYIVLGSKVLECTAGRPCTRKLPFLFLL